jgi:hypothetical protein
MATRAKTKPYWEMTAEELARETSEFDQEFIADTFGPMPPDVRARWERARRKPGRPRRGQGSKAISVSVERTLLARTDRLAKRLGISRAALIARGLEAALTCVGEPED